MSLSDFTVRFFQERLKIEESQIVSVVRNENGSNVKYGHFSYTRQPVGLVMATYCCVRKEYGCKSVLRLPNTAASGINLAIINYELHKHSVSFNNILLH